MKTFFIALLLGILIGCLATVYHYEPNTFDSLIAPKSSSSEKQPIDKAVEKTENILDDTTKASKEAAEDLKEKGESWTDALKEKGNDALESTRDLTIATTIRGKFKLDGEIDSSAITIDVKDGHVTLGGTVPNKDLKLHVIGLAKETKWVEEVKSTLEIK